MGQIVQKAFPVLRLDIIENIANAARIIWEILIIN
jgi:hypothetical protein